MIPSNPFHGGAWTSEGDDYFTTPEFPGTRGCATVHGYAKVLAYGGMPRNLPWIYPAPGGPEYPSGWLPFVPRERGGWPNWKDTGGVSHWLKSCWDCCDPPCPDRLTPIHWVGNGS